ncbi:MAG TPA: PQQ-binding-like beta-propeller repeat protein, partial [Gammaproteobacteria bacterium]|nr:PQQ-binding-like beta-propeller repeat protein [Gammaproteobacteria bacterium]
MDKKSEIALQKRRNAAAPEAPTATALSSSAAAPAAAPAPSGWWMYHGDPAHTGFVSDSNLNTATVASANFKTLATLELGGPILSVPAVTDEFIYVGVANYHKAQGGNGGALHKIDIKSGQTVNTFSWDLGSDNEDAHSFTGMGCTPLVFNNRVYFGAFNGKLYCLSADSLKLQWVTDLRNEDIAPDHNQNQPITNNNGVSVGYPAAVIWTSPVVSADGTKLYVGCGEGENPQLYSFV